MNLLNNCIEILNNDKDKSVSDLLYNVRCQMVHRFYDMSESYVNNLSMLDEAFEQVIYDLLVSYKQ